MLRRAFAFHRVNCNFESVVLSSQKAFLCCYLEGIAAANVEIEGTDVAATTIHALLDLNPDMESKLDFTKGNPKTAALMGLDVLFIDEARSRYSVPSVRWCC